MKPLKILLVEDEPSKKSRLLGLLGKRTDLFASTTSALSANEALEQLRNERFDLLIADVVLPSTLGGERSEENCIALLDEVDALDEGLGAAYVLAVSSAEGLSENCLQYLKARPWGLVPYREESDQALLDIERIAEWIAKHSETPAPSSKCDVFIVCALEAPEFSAMEGVMQDLGPLEPLDDKHLVRYGTLSSGGHPVRVGLGFCQRMGPVSAAILTTKVLQKLSPQLILMAGICAGMEGKSDIGDVLAADMSWDWQSGKYVELHEASTTEFLMAPHQVSISDADRSALVMLKRNAALWSGFSTLTEPLGINIPKLVIGPVASGASVLASGRVLEGIKLQHKNMVGLDMETYALYASAASHPAAVRFVSLKAVCDLGNKHKDDRFQAYAARVSAVAVKTFIENVGSSLLK
jgi:nucleoside phosphorylase/CheY-like chemotaxis protein